jgi:hypothetical protein
VHAKEARQLSKVFGFEPLTKEGFEVEDPLGVVANKGEVIHIDTDHCEDVVVAEDVDARAMYALYPSILH